jgi:copper oxidase (laccase) domain-containing protein
LSRIIQVALAKMTEGYGVSPSTVIAAISPAVGPCCYTVSAERAATFSSTFGSYGGDYVVYEETGQAYLNLAGLNRLQLIESGVPPEAVCVTDLCTSCHTDMFFSYRREQGMTGRFGVIAALRAGR